MYRNDAYRNGNNIVSIKEFHKVKEPIKTQWLSLFTDSVPAVSIEEQCVF